SRAKHPAREASPITAKTRRESMGNASGDGDGKPLFAPACPILRRRRSLDASLPGSGETYRTAGERTSVRVVDCGGLWWTVVMGANVRPVVGMWRAPGASSAPWYALARSVPAPPSLTALAGC